MTITFPLYLLAFDKNAAVGAAPLGSAITSNLFFKNVTAFFTWESETDKPPLNSFLFILNVFFPAILTVKASHKVLFVGLIELMVKMA